MVSNKLAEFVSGWFIGNFEPSLFKTNEVEVGVKHYKAGDKEGYHHHKVATEYTVIVSGSVRMDGNEYVAGEIITIHPNISTNFEALTDTITVVVKLPGANNDKYID